MESAGLNESLYDDTSSLHSLHYGQFSKPPRRKSRFAFGRTYYDEDDDDDDERGEGGEKPVPGRIKYHNYVYVSEDESEGTARSGSRTSNTRTAGRTKRKGRNLRRGKSKSPLTTETEMSEKESLRSPMSREGVNGVYDKLFQRHLKVLKGLESDTEDKSELKSSKSEDEADDLRSSTSESERLSVLGEELVAQSIEEVSGNITNERAKLASTKTDEINTTETGTVIKTPSVETSKKVTFKSKNGEAEEKNEVVESKEENTEPKDHEVKQGRNASKINSVKMKRKE